MLISLNQAGIHELVRNKKSEADGGPGINELQRHFSGGTTGVIINGRELAPRDLTVLKSRGVSDEPRAYWLDIIGQLTDAVTNQVRPREPACLTTVSFNVRRGCTGTQTIYSVSGTGCDLERPLQLFGRSSFSYLCLKQNCSVLE